MKKHLSLLVLCLVAVPAFGAGRSMIGNAQPASRAVVKPVTTAASSIKQDNGAAAVIMPGMGQSGVSVVATDAAPAKPSREKERLACVSNNIGTYDHSTMNEVAYEGTHTNAAGPNKVY